MVADVAVPRQHGASKLTRQRTRSAWIFIAPMLIVLALVAGYPLLSTMYYSLTDRLLIADHDTQFIGFSNYLYYGPDLDNYDEEFDGYFVDLIEQDAFLIYRDDGNFYDLDNVDPDTGDLALYEGEVSTSDVFEWHGVLVDSLWWRSVWNTVTFSVISVGLEIIIGMFVALVLNANLPGRAVIRAAVLIPWAIPTIVSAQMWSWMLNDQYGVINEILLSWGWIDARLAFTADRLLSLPSVIAVDVWKTTPFMALLILAALQLLPGEVYEAAKVDGVHPVRQFFKITLPLIRPALMVAVIFRSLDALRIFDLIYVLTPGSRDSMSMSIWARQNLIDFQNVGYGSALSTSLFLIIACFTAVYLVLGRVSFDQER
ncbi:MAG: sugar ABC transporter permease [Pseudomonadota bacterium]